MPASYVRHPYTAKPISGLRPKHGGTVQLNLLKFNVFLRMYLVCSIFVFFRTEGDAEKEGLRQTIQILQKEMADQSASLGEVWCSFGSYHRSVAPRERSKEQQA